jgi:2-polyprenyl-6-methoxyphenol hydroxylase-like FAD-dependent oxidoreductase
METQMTFRPFDPAPVSEMIDVLIAGAGPAGLTLAIDLARRGVSFRLIDKAEQSFQGSRGKGVQPRSLEVFEDLGVLAPMLAVGGPYPPLRNYDLDGGYEETTITEGAAPSPAEPYATPLMLPQFQTEAILRQRLAGLGHAPEYGAELTRISQNADGVTATLADGRTIRARWLVGADGGRSFVRHALGVDFSGMTMPGQAMVADTILTGLSRQAWHVFRTRDGAQVSFCPLAGTDLFQIQGHAPRTGEAGLTVEGLNTLIREKTGREDIVVHEVLWASVYGFNARLAERYRVGRVLLAGDAAHIHPPTGGQGLNTSIQDAYNLGWKLAAVLNGAPEGLIDTYEAERRPIAAGVLGLSTDLLAKALTREAMKRGREARQLDLGYEGSSLSLDLGVAAKVAPGDRAPDAPCQGPDGRPIRVFEVLAGPHWTLLGATAIAPRPGVVVSDLVDTDGWFADAYGLPSAGFVLVRPDGYIATVGQAGDEASVEAYLTEMGVPTVASSAARRNV